MCCGKFHSQLPRAHFHRWRAATTRAMMSSLSFDGEWCGVRPRIGQSGYDFPSLSPTLELA